MQIDEFVNQAELMIKEGYGEYVSVNGINIRYRVRGSGPPVVLLHGLGGFLEMWWLNVVPLSEKYKVYAIDLPGHGLSDMARNCYKPNYATEYALAILKALDLERVDLVGHSMGGLISINLSVGFPEKVRKLVLVDSAGLSGYVPLRFRLLAIPFWGRLLIELAERNFYKTGIRYLFYNKQISDEVVALFMRNSDRIWSKQEILDLSRNHLGLRGIRSDSLVVNKLPHITCPTLFIHGAQDKIFPLADVENSFRLVCGAKVEIIERAGHIPQIEQATIFNKLVKEFL